MDLFDAINKLYTKEELDYDNLPSDLLLHRFFATKLEYAPIVLSMSILCRDRQRCWKLWQTALPKRKKAPFFVYGAAKKEKNVELVTAYMKQEHVPNDIAKEELAILELLEKTTELKHEFGID